MIIRDDHGEILIDSKISHLLIDQNGNHWELTDEVDGLAIELISNGAFDGISVIPVAVKCVKIKPELLPRATARRNSITRSPTKVGVR